MALRFWLGTGGDALWSNINNWAATSGGTPGVAVPLATDDVTFDAAGNNACTLNTSARVAKTLTVNGFTNTVTFDQQLSVSGSITFTTTGFTFAGATTNKLRMIAAGTWTTNGKTIPQDVEIGGTTTFTCTLAQDLTTSGTLTLNNSTSTVFAGAFLLTAANCTISGTQTVTIANDLQITATTTIGDNCGINGSGKRWLTGGLTLTGDLAGGASQASLTFNGTGTLQGAGVLTCDFTIDTAGTLTVSGVTNLTKAGTITITHVTGTVVTTGSTLSFSGSASTFVAFDTSGVTWNAITIVGSFGSVISTSLLRITTLTLPNAVVGFSGSPGWTTVNFTNTVLSASRVWTFAAGVTYTITGSWTTVHTVAQTVRFSLVSSSPGTKFFFILGPGATQDLGFVDPTDCDASLGQKIFTYRGVVTTSPNWTNVRTPNLHVQQPVYQLGI